MQQTKITLTDEEQANVNLLEIHDGRLTAITAPDKLIGSLVLPDAVTEIGWYVFQNCGSLTRVTIPD